MLRQLNDESRALGIYAVDRDLTTHKINKLLYYGKSETRTLDIPVGRFIHTAERVEKIGNVFLAYPYARIAYREYHLYISVRSPFTLHGQCDGAFMCVLYRIVKDIDKYLLYTHLIAVQLGRDIRSYVHIKL